MENRNEWVIHVWGKKRDVLELTWVEKFHIDMLRLFQNQQKKFDKILINIALDDVNDLKLFDFLKGEISKVLVNNNVEFLYCQNDPIKGEYVTFRPYVFDRIGEETNVFYSHFKGYSTHLTIRRESFPLRVIDLCEMFWSYIMYRYSLNISDVQKKLKTNSVYAWFILKNNVDEHNIGYFKKYQNSLFAGNEVLKKCVEDDLCKHSPGSFLWYNLKNIGKSLENKPEVTSISTDYLVKNTNEQGVGLCTHFCESYLIPFLKESECYSVNDFNKDVYEMEGTLYTQIYPTKKIAREFIKDFEKYLIENNII